MRARTRTTRRLSPAERQARTAELRQAIAGLGRNRPPRPTLDELLADDALSAPPGPSDPDRDDRTPQTITHDLDEVNRLLAEAAALDRASERRATR